MKKQDKILSVILIVGLVGFVLFADAFFDSYIRRVLNLCAIYTILAVSMNLINGFTGLFSLGHAGFMALGAYVVGIFTVPVEMRPMIFYLEPMNKAIAGIEMPFVVALLVGGILAALVAFFIGAPVLRLKDDYLAIATLGFSEIIRIIITNAQNITNGSLGIKGIPTTANMYWIFGAMFVTIVLIVLLISSSYGRALKAIREDEIAAEAMGINLFRHKMLSFMIGAFFAGIAGGLYGSLLGTVDPKNFQFVLTYNFLLIIVLGGMGSISGSIISAFVVTAGQEWLRFLDAPLSIGGFAIPLFRPGFRMVIFSVLLMVIVLFYPNGLMGTKELNWKLLKDIGRGIKNRFTIGRHAKGGEVQ